MPAINVARTDTFELQRQKINQIGDQIFSISQGGSDLSTGNLKLGDGTLSAPSLAFVNDVKLGIYRVATNVLGFASNSKKILDIELEGVKSFKDFSVVRNSLSPTNTLIASGGQNYDVGSYNAVPIVGGSGSNATVDIAVVEYTGSVTNSGDGYAGGSYTDQSLSGGNGTGAIVDYDVTSILGSITNPGSGYVEAIYTAVALTGGNGTGATADIEVDSNGAVVDVIITAEGDNGYDLGDVLSASNADLGGSGSGFAFTISNNPGTVENFTISQYGTGYQVGDVLTIPGTGSPAFAYTINAVKTVSSITINNPGVGYNAGDVLSVDPTSLTQPITYAVTVIPTQKLTFTGTVADTKFSKGDTLKGIEGAAIGTSLDGIYTGTVSQTYSNVQLNAGSGTGLIIDFETDETGELGISNIVATGYNYTQGQQISVPSGSVGGIAGVVLNVDSVSVRVEVSCLAVYSSGGNIDYIVIEEDTNLSNGELIDISTGGIATAETIATISTQNQYLLDDGNVANTVADKYHPNLTLYSGNTYEFNLTDTSVSTHPFELSETPDGVHTSYAQNSVVLDTSSTTITVTDTTNIVVGMPVAVTGGTGSLDAATVVTSVDDATTITLSLLPLTNGTADLSFTGYEYSTGVVKVDGNLRVKVSDTTPNLYYYCQVHSAMGGTSPNFHVLPTDTNNPKVFGSGLLINAVSIDSVVAVGLDVDAGIITGNSLSAVSGAVETFVATTSITTPTISTTDITCATLSSTNTIVATATNGMSVIGNLSVGSNLTISNSNGNLETSGEIKSTGSFNSDNRVKLQGDTLSAFAGNNINLTVTGENVVRVNGTSALGIPSGTELDKPTTNYNGYIRFNTDTTQYEGYSEATSSWSSLGGVRDIDGSTYIIAEATVGANDNTLYFYNDNVNTLQLGTEFLDFRSVKKISSARLGLPTYTLWTAGAGTSVGDYIKHKNNLYEVTGIVNLGQLAGTGGEPSHTSGTAANGDAQLTWFSSAVSPLTISEVEEFRIGPDKDCPLVVGGELTFDDNVVSTQVQDLVLRPNAGKQTIVDSVTHFRIPAGTDNEKSIAAAGPGSIRFNTDIQQFEGYSGANWSSLGGVRDVDGNTYIIPETAPAANENILYFYNNNVNTLQLSGTALDFTNIDTITTSGGNTLGINTEILTLNSLDTTIDNSDSSSTFISTTKQYLDLGLSSGLNVDPVLRLDNQGDIYFNTTFGTGSFNGVKVFDGDLKEFELADYAIRTFTFSLIKGGSESSAVILYNTSTAKGCKVTALSKSSSGKRSMAEYNVIDNGTDIFHNEFGSLNTSLDQFTAAFDFTGSSEPRVTFTLSNDHAISDIVSFTVLVQEIK